MALWHLLEKKKKNTLHIREQLMYYMDQVSERAKPTQDKKQTTQDQQQTVNV